MNNDMKKNLMRIAASMVACGVCLCAHGFSTTAGAKAKLKELGIAVPLSSESVDELRQRDNATFINNAF